MSDHLRLELDGGTVLFTTRHGGVSSGPFASLNLGLWTEDDSAKVLENRDRVRAEAGAARLAQGRQVHGARVAVESQGIVEADGQATARRGVAPTVLVADCLPIALVSPEAVAMLHAGWRGLAEGVVAEGVAALRGLGASRIAAAIGPGAGPCCYEVGDEVRSVFGCDGQTIDLKAIAREHLQAAGAGEVHDVGICTICDERFFSHRRERGLTGRQAGVVWRS
jgi:YfiH family protein